MAKKDSKSLLLRLSPAMWDAIAKWADDEFRSVNGQIEYLLYDALVRSKRLKKGQLTAASSEPGEPDEKEDSDLIP